MCIQVCHQISPMLRFCSSKQRKTNKRKYEQQKSENKKENFPMNPKRKIWGKAKIYHISKVLKKQQNKKSILKLESKCYNEIKSWIKYGKILTSMCIM